MYIKKQIVLIHKKINFKLMKTSINFKELKELSIVDSKKINGGSEVSEAIFRFLGWLTQVQMDGYVEMHDAGLLSYRH